MDSFYHIEMSIYLVTNKLSAETKVWFYRFFSNQRFFMENQRLDYLWTKMLIQFTGFLSELEFLITKKKMYLVT